MLSHGRFFVKWFRYDEIRIVVKLPNVSIFNFDLKLKAAFFVPIFPSKTINEDFNSEISILDS